MVYKSLICTLAGLLALGCVSETKNGFDVDKPLAYCHTQCERTLAQIGDTTMMPRNIATDQVAWNLVPVCLPEWTIGFWPGILWYDYEASGDEAVKAHAIHYTELLDPLSSLPAYDHDLGFQIFCSYGNAYRLTGNEKYKRIILRNAATLATLFNPKVGTILSWPREVEPRGWPHNTIMDNMMNLEMLYWAARNGGDPAFADIATRHAEVTMRHQFREDGSNYHVAIYDTISGDFIKGVTHQGYKDSTLWARGQAWAIYGYSMVYRETGDKQFLRFAEKVTDLYLSRLPEDYVPYWDFDAPQDKLYKDASAAAIVAAGLIELSQSEDSPPKAKEYMAAAEKMLESLSSPAYQSGESKPSFLLHSVGHLPNGYEIDASINYADYYYIEALVRYRNYLDSK